MCARSSCNCFILKQPWSEWERNLRDGQRQHLFFLASAGDLGGSAYDTVVIAHREGNRGLFDG